MHLDVAHAWIGRIDRMRVWDWRREVEVEGIRSWIMLQYLLSRAVLGDLLHVFLKLCRKVWNRLEGRNIKRYWTMIRYPVDRTSEVTIFEQIVKRGDGATFDAK